MAWLLGYFRGDIRVCRFSLKGCQHCINLPTFSCIFHRLNCSEMFFLKRWPAAFPSSVTVHPGHGGLWEMMNT